MLPRKIRPVLALLTLLAAGCASTPSTSPVMDEVGTIEISSRELRLRMYDLQTRMAVDIERAADQIILETDDPQVRHNALLWKANGIPALHLSVFQPDPMGSLLDVSIFSNQMRDFFDHGAGRDLFGDQQPIAVDACGKICADVLSVGVAAAQQDSFPEAKALVDNWCAENPFEDLSFRRESTLTLWAAVVGDARASGLAAVGSMEDGMADMIGRSKIYARDLPKVAMWQAEAVASGYVTPEDAQAFLVQFRDMEAEMDLIAVRFDEFVARVDTMYAESWRGIAREREALMQGVDLQRVATLVYMHAEVEAMQDFVRQERAAIMVDAEAMRTNLDGQARGLIDHMIWRLAQLATAILAVALLVGVVLIRLARRGGSRPT